MCSAFTRSQYLREKCCEKIEVIILSFFLTYYCLQTNLITLLLSLQNQGMTQHFPSGKVGSSSETE